MDSGKPSSIIEILQKAFRENRRKQRLSVLLFPLSLAILFLTLLLIIEKDAYLDISIKSISIFIIIVTSLVLAWWLKSRQKFRDFTSFYRDFGTSQNVKELNYVIDLSNNSNGNEVLIQAAIEQNLKQVASVDLKEKLNGYIRALPQHNLFRQALILLVSATLGLFLLGFANPDATIRTLSFWESFEKPNPYQYIIDPGNLLVEQGTSFEASIIFEGNQIPEEVNLAFKTKVEEDYRYFNLEKTENRYASLPITINSDTDYYFEMDGFKSELSSIRAQLRPRFNNLAVKIKPPTYTNIEESELDYPFSELRPPVGSELEIIGELNKPVNSFEISSSHQDSFDINLDETNLSFSINYPSSEIDTLSFSLLDEAGLENSNNFKFIVNPVTDAYPFVEILEPGSSLEEIEPAATPILFRANDDYQLTSVSFYFQVRKAFLEPFEAQKIPLEVPDNSSVQSFLWNVQDQNLSPQDEIDFWIEVTDNDQYNGFKTTQSQILTLRVPSLVDYFDELQEEEDSVATSLEEISESFDEIGQQYEELKEELRNEPQNAWQQKNEVEALQEKQEEIEKQLEELNERFDELKEELEENQLLSDETLEAYDELQKLLEEIDDPALLEALEQLQQSLDSFSPEQLRKALEEVEFNEQAYQERIERTIELFKQLQLTSDLEKIAKAAEDLAKQQEENQGAENSLEQAKNTQEQLEKLNEQIEKLDENATDKTKKPVEEFQKDSQKELDEAKEKLEQQQSDQGEQSPSQQQKKEELQQNFQKVADQARQTAEALNAEQQRVNIAGLYYVLYSLINISEEQEDLNGESVQAKSRSLAFIEFAREQRNLDQIFNIVSDSLYSLSKDIPGLSNEIIKKRLTVEKEIKQALNLLAERDSPKASVATRQVLGGINDLAFLIANVLEQNQSSSGSGSGGGDPMQQLQDAAGDQQQLNQQLQDMINDVQGQKLTKDQSERLKQLSKQQNEIRKQLQDIQKNGGFEQGDKIGSELERLIEEIEETINDIRGGAIDQITVDRQQNILSRMLEAEKALEERDEEDKREGKTGEDIPTQIPPTMTLEELEKEIRSRLNDPNFTKFSPDYQRLIETYFELLKKLNSSEIQ